MTSVELRREKHTQTRPRSHASGLLKLQEGKVRLLYRLSIYFIQSSVGIQIQKVFLWCRPGNT
jgi:hypothetical protein